MRRLVLFLLILTVIHLTPARAPGAVWRVRLDGSGDFSAIAPAVAAASPGDTLLLGPGRFDTFVDLEAPAWTQPTIIPVLKDSLTFLGAGVDSTFIGTATFHGEGGEPKAVCAVGGFSGRLAHMTIENVKTGIYWWGGNLHIDHCRFRGTADPFTYYGLIVELNDFSISRCSFQTGGANIGLGLLGATGEVAVTDCRFSGERSVGVYLGAAPRAAIGECVFTGVGTGIDLEAGTSATVRDCRMLDNQRYGLVVNDDSRCRAERVLIRQAGTGVRVGRGSRLSGRDIQVQAPRQAVVDTAGGGQVEAGAIVVTESQPSAEHGVSVGVLLPPAESPEVAHDPNCDRSECGPAAGHLHRCSRPGPAGSR